jgi:hypothetical protein
VPFPLATFSSSSFIYFSKSFYFFSALLAFQAKKFSFVTGVKPSLLRAALSSSIYSSRLFFSS